MNGKRGLVVNAPAGAPNVLVVLIDDSGLGWWSTFGWQMPTPNLDKVTKARALGLAGTRPLLSSERCAFARGDGKALCPPGWRVKA